MKYYPKVSIVIPAYNASNYLAQAIESALHQDYKNLEVIVVNDGSNDNGKTREVALAFGDTIRYFEKENGGSSSALNVGISKMTGDWFSWLSHDDLYYENKVSREIELLNQLIDAGLQEKQIYKQVCFTPSDIINANGELIKKSNKNKCLRIKKIYDSPNANSILISYPIQLGFYGCSCLIHKKVFEKIGVFDESLRLLNDMDMWFRLYSNGYKINYIADALVLERIHGAQVSKSIGYSYHNKEQDIYWQRSLKWLIDNCQYDYDLFYNYGVIAYEKTRYNEGREAFAIAAEIDSKKKYRIWIDKRYYFVKSQILYLAKQVYFRLKK
jgi:hypothetical protein